MTFHGLPTVREGPETPTECRCESVSDGPTDPLGQVPEMITHLKREFCASPLGVGPKVTNPKIGRKRRGGNLTRRPNTVFQLPTARWIETRPRMAPKAETHTAFAMYVFPSNWDSMNLKLKLNWFRQKMAMNLHVKMPPKSPFLGSMKQGPLFRKRVIVKQVWRKGLLKLKSPSLSRNSGSTLFK